MMPGMWIAAHVLYGIGLGSAPALRRRWAGGAGSAPRLAPMIAHVVIREGHIHDGSGDGF
jgi:hypothetical protein